MVSLLTGEPEYLDPLGAEAPEGWLVTGYPWAEIDTPEHEAFLDAFQDQVERAAQARRGGRLRDDPFDRGDAGQGGLDRDRRDDRGDGGARGRHAVRPDHLARDRPPGDDGRLRRPHRGQGRPAARWSTGATIDGSAPSCRATRRSRRSAPRAERASGRSYSSHESSPLPPPQPSPARGEGGDGGRPTVIPSPSMGDGLGAGVCWPGRKVGSSCGAPALTWPAATVITEP